MKEKAKTNIIPTLIKFKKGDTVKINIDFERLRKDKRYNGMTGIIIDTVDLRSISDDGIETVIKGFEYVVYLHRKRETCVFSDKELEFDNSNIKKRRLKESKEIIRNDWLKT